MRRRRCAGAVLEAEWMAGQLQQRAAAAGESARAVPSAFEPPADLGDLFRLECETHSTALVDGLLQLERTPGETAVFDKLMRAAHSLKGAGRVMGLERLVQLAHTLEDVLSRVKNEQHLLGCLQT